MLSGQIVKCQAKGAMICGSELERINIVGGRGEAYTSEKLMVERTNWRGRQAGKCSKEEQERIGCGMKVNSRTNLYTVT